MSQHSLEALLVFIAVMQLVNAGLSIWNLVLLLRR
jgi:hypothetical protein